MAAEWNRDNCFPHQASLPATPFPLAVSAHEACPTATKLLADDLAWHSGGQQQVYLANQAPHLGAHQQPRPSHQVYFCYKRAPL